MFLNDIRRNRIPGSVETSSGDKTVVFGSIYEQTGNRSVGIADDCQTPGQQRSHHIHFRFGRVMMPAHNSLQGDAFICVAAGRSLRRCQRQQPLTESVNIQLMISPLGRQEMVELEDATILESPQDADSNPNELCGISLPVDLSRTSARD